MMSDSERGVRRESGGRYGISGVLRGDTCKRGAGGLLREIKGRLDKIVDKEDGGVTAHVVMASERLEFDAFGGMADSLRTSAVGQDVHLAVSFSGIQGNRVRMVFPDQRRSAAPRADERD